MAAEGPPKMCTGIVKLVLSGDSVVIRGVPKGGPPPEKTLRFSGVTAPRLARRPGRDEEPGEASVDEPMAWESREFLRRKLIGKEINFQIEYSVPSGQEFGTVFIPGPGAQPENVTHTMIAEGLVSLREGRREEGPEAMALAAIQSQVADQGKGMWHADKAKHVRKIAWNCDDLPRLVAEHGNKPVNAVIEHVRDGCNMRAFLLPSMQNVAVSITGIKTPGFRRQDGGPEKAEPFAGEAKFFVESRLLQRNLKLTLEGVAGNSVLASVQHPRGDIAEILVNEGYAKVVDWSVNSISTPGQADKLRAAQAKTMAERKRIWANYTSPTAGMAEADKAFSAKVVEIKNCERLVVLKGGVPTEVSLSSTRQPRKPKTDAPAGGDDGAFTGPRPIPLFDVPFMLEGREFLRKQLLGKTVDITVDYISPADGKFPEKTCVTIRSEGTNIAEALIGRGFATVLRHKADDDSRSSCYGDLASAEERASKGNKGVHSVKPGQPAPVTRVADVRDKAAADIVVGSVQRRGRVAAIVEAVIGGARMRLYIPKETTRCTIMLAGISAPRTAFKESKGEDFAEESKQFASDMVLQRDVDIEVFDSDKSGNLIGSVYLNGVSLADKLLEEGLGKMHFSASRYGNEASLSAAEAGPKAAKKNVWANYDPSQDEPRELRSNKYGNEDGPTERNKASKEALVTHIVDSNTFYAQYTSDAEKLAELSELLNKTLTDTAPEPFTPKRNQVCAAKFDADGSWYRAKVLRITDGNFEILYSDYGNSQTVTGKVLAALPEEVEALGLAPQAKLMKLALLGSPPEDYAEEATGVLADGILNKTFMANTEYLDRTDDGAEALYVTLADEDADIDDVAKTMVLMGYATVFRRRDRNLQDLYTEYSAAQKDAAKTRQGMWMYGDITEDPKSGF